MNLDAAIGFKRHIQVLNYMMSNWPAYCPMPVVTRRTLKHGESPFDHYSARVLVIVLEVIVLKK